MGGRRRASGLATHPHAVLLPPQGTSPRKQAHNPVHMGWPMAKEGPTHLSHCRSPHPSPVPASGFAPRAHSFPPPAWEAAAHGSRRCPGTHQQDTSCSSARDRPAGTRPGRSQVHRPAGAPSSRKGDGGHQRSRCWRRSHTHPPVGQEEAHRGQPLPSRGGQRCWDDTSWELPTDAPTFGLGPGALSLWGKTLFRFPTQVAWSTAPTAAV